MTDKDYRDSIARLWMGKSETALKSASVLLREELLAGCVNRLYYAAFYAVSAALATQGREYGKHTAVRAALNRDFVKPGIVDASCSTTYNRLFDDRQSGDYAPETLFEKAEINELLEQTAVFIECFKKLL